MWNSTGREKMADMLRTLPLHKTVLRKQNISASVFLVDSREMLYQMKEKTMIVTIIFFFLINEGWL